MLIGTADRTRLAVGGPGKAYLEFQPKQVPGAETTKVPVWWLIDVNEIVGGGNS